MPFPDCRFPILALPKHRGFKPPPLGGLFLGWGFKPQPKNFALICQLLTQSHKLFSSRWVNANSHIKVFLGSSHINRDRHTLNNFTRVFPNHVHA
jgi:hypothetical protein